VIEYDLPPEQIEALLVDFAKLKHKLLLDLRFVKYFGDLNTAAVYAEIVEWSRYYADEGRKIRGLEGSGWFWRAYGCADDREETDEDGKTLKKRHTWYSRLGLEERVVRKAVKRLESLGMIETVLKKAEGNPTLHYRYVTGKLLELLVTSKMEETKQQKMWGRNSKKCGVGTTKIAGSITCVNKTVLTQGLTAAGASAAALPAPPPTPLTPGVEAEIDKLPLAAQAPARQTAREEAERGQGEDTIVSAIRKLVAALAGGVEIANPGGWLRQAIRRDYAAADRQAEAAAAEQRRQAEEAREARRQAHEQRQERERQEAEAWLVANPEMAALFSVPVAQLGVRRGQSIRG